MKGLAIFCLVVHITHAHASPTDDVVIAGRDAALGAALTEALAPQRVIAVDDAAPTSIGDLAAASRRLVERENTRSAIWLISDGETTTLVAYHRDVDRVLVRALPYPAPLSDENAAVTARSARAMLRALVDTQVAPVHEVVKPAPLQIPASNPKPQLATHAGLAVRLGAPGRDANPELTLGAIWRPTALGLALTVSLAPASELRTMSFAGDIGDRTVAVAARMPFELRPRLRVAALAGVSLHAIRFAGASTTRTIADWQFDPAVQARVEGAFGLTTNVDVGVAIATDGLLVRQRYEVDGQEVVEMARLQVSSGVFVSLTLL